MAINVTGVAWSGQQANTWYSELFSMSTTYDKCVVLEAVKGKTQIPNITGGGVITAASCNFTASGDIDLSDKELEVVRLAVMKEWCKDELTQTRFERFLRQGNINDGAVGTELEDKITQFLQIKMAEEIEYLLWQGDTSGSTGTYLDEMDGFLVQFAASSITAFGGSVALNVANYQTQMRAWIADMATDAVFAQHMFEPEFSIKVPPHVRALHYATMPPVTGIPNAGANIATLEMWFDGIRLEMVPGLPANTMVACRWTDLFIGTDLTDDKSNLRVIDLEPVTGDEKVRVKGGFKLGTQCGSATAIKLYQV